MSVGDWSPSLFPFLSIQALAPPQGIPIASLFWRHYTFNFIDAGRQFLYLYLVGGTDICLSYFTCSKEQYHNQFKILFVVECYLDL